MKSASVLAILISLQACGGGGDNTDVTAAYAADLSTSEYSYDDDFVLYNITTTVNGDTIEVSTDTGLLINGSENTSAVVNATGYIAASFPLGTFYGTYEDEDGNMRSFSTVVDVLNDLGFARADTVTGTWNWANVQYGLTTSTGTDISEEYGDDGAIEVNTNTGTWTAELGGVSLEGEIDGMIVSGEATYGNATGTFEGVDGIYELDGTSNFYTIGGFAGAGGDETFAGGWANIIQ